MSNNKLFLKNEDKDRLLSYISIPTILKCQKYQQIMDFK